MGSLDRENVISKSKGKERVVCIQNCWNIMFEVGREEDEVKEVEGSQNIEVLYVKLVILDFTWREMESYFDFQFLIQLVRLIFKLSKKIYFYFFGISF